MARRWSFLGPLFVAVMLLSSLAPVVAQEPETHGINPADMDLSVDPREDFYRFANGGWLDRTEIPADRGSFGVFAELDVQMQQQLLGLLTGLAGQDDLAEGSDQWKAITMFEQGMDMETRNAQDLAPIQPFLDDIAAIETVEDFHNYLMIAPFQYMSATIGVGVAPALEDATMNAVYMGGPFLSLPNRDYYLGEDPSFEPARAAFIAANARMFQLLGYDEAAATAAAEAEFELERTLAEQTLTREERQNLSLANNPMSLDELSAAYPLVDWTAYLEGLGMTGVETVIVTEVKYLDALAGITEETPIEVLRDYLYTEMLWSFAGRLDQDIYDIAFDFNQALTGVAESRPLEERVLALVNSSYADAVGQLYVEEYFPPEAKAQIESLVSEIILAFGDRLDRVEWMSPEAKEEARVKLANMGVKVGYPDEWETYEDAEIEESYAMTALSAINAELRENYAKAGQPVDREEWTTPVQTVNAFYSPATNQISFPAGILQPPFFDYQADPAANYGAIGFVIGHEITHGFDLQGSQRDANGNLGEWWSAEDRERFLALNELVVDQYSAIEVLPDLFVNGQLTVTENAADLGGIQVAYDALNNYLTSQGLSMDSVVEGALAPVPSGTPAAMATPADGASPVADRASPVADTTVTDEIADAAASLATPTGATPAAKAAAVAEFTQRQRFFIAAATVWRSKYRDETLQTQVLSGVHSPGMVRATQPIRNHDAFFEAFGIDDGDKMFLPPDERVVIW